MNRPDWLKEGKRVWHRGTQWLGTVGGDAPFGFFVEWDAGSRTAAALRYWERNLEPVEVFSGPHVSDPDYFDRNEAVTEEVVDSMESKPTNPKDSIGITKAPLSVIPIPSLYAVAQAMLHGSLKYGRHNYREAGVRFSVYFDACMRHMASWWEGEDIDPESGLPHLAHAATAQIILLDAIRQGKFNDDRPPKTPAGWVQELNEATKVLLDKYPNPVQPFTEKPK